MDQWFGYASEWLGDVDGDGWHDLAVSSPGYPLASNTAQTRGVVFVLGGRDGALLRTFQAAPGETYFGFGLAAIDDLDGDGVGELIVWVAPRPEGDERPGLIRALSPKTGETLWEHGSAPGFTYVHGVRAIPDVDGDGLADIATWGNDAQKAAGGDDWQRLEVLSGKDGGVLTERLIHGPEWFRITSVQPIEDQDGDGSADLVLLSHEQQRSDRSYNRIEIRSGASLERFGEIPVDVDLGVVLEATDVDGDGRSEILTSVRGVITAHPPEGEIDEPVPGAILVMDVDSRSLRRVIVARSKDGAPKPVASLGVLEWSAGVAGPEGSSEHLLVAGASDIFNGQVFGLDPVTGQWRWTLGGEVAAEHIKTDDWVDDHLGEHVAVDPKPDASDRYSALTGTGNPHWPHNHTVWCFDPTTGVVRFIVDSLTLFDQAGL